ncbi:MAG: DUF2937 family protein [Opitutaceae bacterium]|nr:DUF2937 family protein [Opitutaceae bacterium]
MIGRTGETLLDRVLCVAGAVVFSQAPEFMQQYFQRLGGHLDEATRQLRQFEHVAEQAGESVSAFATRAQASADTVMARMGDIVAGAITRVDDLSAAVAALRNATPWSRPFVFLEHVDVEIARATWGAFKPAVPTTFEGALYAAAGMIVFLALYHGAIRAPIAAATRRARARRADGELPRVRPA